LTLSSPQFGFDGGDVYVGRRDSLFSTLQSNPRAKFVTRAVQYGSEPLFDKVLEPSALAQQVTDAKRTLASLEIPVIVSDMVYSFQRAGQGGKEVLDAIDYVGMHALPCFSPSVGSGIYSLPRSIFRNPHYRVSQLAIRGLLYRMISIGSCNRPPARKSS
jgi:hypothetical protein